MSRTLAVATALALALPAAAQQRPYIDVGSPTFQPLPIAVADFQGEGDARGREVSDVVRSDLALSGVFDVLDPKGFLADPAEGYAAPAIRFARWADVGAEGLAKARVRRASAELEGELHLYEVRAGREALATTVRTSAADPRALGHRIADEIVRYYTREPGVFSTRIVAIRKARGVYELVLFDSDGRNPRTLLSE
ncbi:MAG TPA: protein TolB, partial [Anaeromyxobacter sp.]